MGLYGRVSRRLEERPLDVRARSIVATRVTLGHPSYAGSPSAIAPAACDGRRSNACSIGNACAYCSQQCVTGHFRSACQVRVTSRAFVVCKRVPTAGSDVRLSSVATASSPLDARTGSSRARWHYLHGVECGRLSAASYGESWRPNTRLAYASPVLRSLAALASRPSCKRRTSKEASEATSP